MSTAYLGTLRDLLADAVDIVDLVDGELESEPKGVGYFQDDGHYLDDAVSRVAAHDGEIAMFVGAGVSMESSLPSWTVLLHRLLDELGAEMDDAERAEWIRLTLGEGPLAAAQVARAIHDDEVSFRAALRRALYGDLNPDHYRPGALAVEIAKLKVKLGPRLRILTANYDGLLETALADEGADPVSYVRRRNEPDQSAAVWHLHGRLMRAPSGMRWRTEGQLVLSEGDYVRSSAAQWPQDYVAWCLQNCLCVFVGLSMTDPNFIRWLYRSGAAEESNHLAIFVRQGAPSVGGSVRKKLEQSASARWKAAGVEPVWTNYYGEVAQLVHEFGLKCEDDQCAHFLKRSSDLRAVGAALLRPDDPEEFIEVQRLLSEWLKRRVEDIKAIAQVQGVKIDGANWGLGLWVANHADGVAELWGTSERLARTPLALERRPLQYNSNWVGVEAITRGVAVEHDPRVYTTRWRFIRGIPLAIDADGTRVPIGALTLTSTMRAEQCPLSISSAPPGLLMAMDNFLTDEVSGFFTN